MVGIGRKRGIIKCVRKKARGYYFTVLIFKNACFVFAYKQMVIK